jgi:hypothetical protein
VGEDDLDLEEQICTCTRLALNPEVRVLGKARVERILRRSALVRCAAGRGFSP